MIIFLFLLTRPDQLMAGGVLPVILEQHLIIRQRRACPAQPIMFQVQSAYDLSLFLQECIFCYLSLVCHPSQAIAFLKTQQNDFMKIWMKYVSRS